MFTEDLSLFFDTNDFAVVATIKRPDNSTLRNANVIFDNSLGPLAVFDVEVEAGMQKVRIQTADLASVAVGIHTMVVNSITYRITKRDDGDGTGVSTVWLKK